MHFVQAGGHRLEYRWIQPARAPAVTTLPVLVFLHEGLGCVALWKRFPAAVANATGCRVLVYSRHGYGSSDPLTEPRRADYMHREALETLPEVLDALSIRNPALIGHSDGASIALIHAGAGRRDVRGIVAMAPHVFVEELSLVSIAGAKVAFDTTDLADKLGRYHADVTGAFRGWNDIWLHPDFRAWSIESCLPDIRCPVLLIQGEDDGYGTVAQIETIERRVAADVRTLKLARCGHAPHVDQTDATLRAITAFVGGLAG